MHEWYFSINPSLSGYTSITLWAENKAEDLALYKNILPPKTCINYFQKENYAFNINQL